MFPMFQSSGWSLRYLLLFCRSLSGKTNLRGRKQWRRRKFVFCVQSGLRTWAISTHSQPSAHDETVCVMCRMMGPSAWFSPQSLSFAPGFKGMPMLGPVCHLEQGREWSSSARTHEPSCCISPASSCTIPGGRGIPVLFALLASQNSYLRVPCPHWRISTARIFSPLS